MVIHRCSTIALYACFLVLCEMVVSQEGRGTVGRNCSMLVPSLRTQGASHPAVLLSQVQHLRTSPQLPMHFCFSCSRFIKVRAKEILRGNKPLLLRPLLRGISPTYLLTQPFALKQRKEAQITAVNHNLPICLLAHHPIAFILAVLFLHCLFSKLCPRVCHWWGAAYLTRDELSYKALQ